MIDIKGYGIITIPPHVNGEDAEVIVHLNNLLLAIQSREIIMSNVFYIHASPIKTIILRIKWRKTLKEIERDKIFYMNYRMEILEHLGMEDKCHQ